MVERKGFELFVCDSGPDLVRLASFLCGDRGLAEDAVQEAMVRLYTNWWRVRDPNAYCKTALIRLIRRQHSRPSRSEIPVDPDVAFTAIAAPSTEADVDIELRAALQSLPLGQREIIVLRFVLDQSVEATARIAHCSSGTVKSQTTRGLARLRSLLAVKTPQ